MSVEYHSSIQLKTLRSGLQPQPHHWAYAIISSRQHDMKMVSWALMKWKGDRKLSVPDQNAGLLVSGLVKGLL